MATSRVPSIQLLRTLRRLNVDATSSSAARSITTSSMNKDQVQIERPSFYKNPSPETAYIPRLERKLAKAGTPPIGSRRRRMALAKSQKIPFDELPYQCFQEARQILIEDRTEKLKKIETERARIQRLLATDADTFAGGDSYKQRRIESMQQELDRLKILADINDPNVKRRFEDGNGDMNKPIYRFLAERKWREYNRKIQLQRLSQMKVVPDVIPHLDPLVDVTVKFGAVRVQPGQFVDSRISEVPAKLNVQSFARGERLITVAVIDPDVPNLQTDGFDSRCHFLASNITISPARPRLDLAQLLQSQTLQVWHPPTAQKGSPYHRLSVLIFQQKDNVPIDMSIAAKKVQRDQFSMRGFMTRHMLQPIGGTLFRTKWDDDMAAVMMRAGVEGAHIELKRTKVEPLPYKRRNPSTFR